MDIFFYKLCNFISHISRKTLSTSWPAALRHCQARGNFLIDLRGLLCKATLCAVVICPDLGWCVSLPGDCCFHSNERLCISFGRISFHSTRLFFKGKVCFQAPSEQCGLPKIRVTNWHTGSKLGSLNAITIPSLFSDETQMGTELLQITAY